MEGKVIIAGDLQERSNNEMKDLLNKEVTLGNYIVYMTRGSTGIRVTYGKVVGLWLNDNNELRMRVDAITKSYYGNYRYVGHTSLTTAAKFLIVDALPAEIAELL